MKERDPGNCPAVNDRISFVTVALPNSKKLLQAERIEHPDYIIKNNLKIDYLFYITNQILNPCIQFFELLTDELSDVFSNIINIENRINEKIFDKQARIKGLTELRQFGVYENKDIKIDNDWIDDNMFKKDITGSNNILIDYCINQNMVKPKKRIIRNSIVKRKNKFLDMTVGEINNNLSI